MWEKIMYGCSSVYVFLTLLVAFLISFSATPFVISLAKKIGAIDVPKDARRVHTKPIPSVGGLAIFYGFLVSVLCFGIIDLQMIMVILGAFVIVALGVLDDVKPINAKVKFFVQILAALIVVSSGLRVDHMTNPNIFSPRRIIIFSDAVSILLTIFWIVGITNTVNLIDGLDGLAVGISSIASVAMLSLSLILKEPNVAIIAAGVAGASFGFLPYNFNPAKIFIGDTGATFLGFILACTSIMGFFKTQALISFLSPLVILGLPIFDTTCAIIRRIAHKKPIMLPDRGHLHHRLLDAGFTQRQAVGILYTMASALSLSAVVMIVKDAVRAVFLVCSVIFLLLFGAKQMIYKNSNSPDDKEEKDG
jgi:UDP-GlcNAc:undecaprenyl-phosphate GlcNAc-1-phosphate transferase